MWFLLPRYLLNSFLLLKHHPALLLRTYLDHLRKTSATTARSMVMLSLSVVDCSLSNLLARTPHSSLFTLLLLPQLKSPLRAPFLNFPWDIFKPFYINFSHIQIVVKIPHKFYLSPQVLLRHGILIMPVATKWHMIPLVFLPQHILLLHLLFILQTTQLSIFKMYLQFTPLNCPSLMFFIFLKSN